jgi:hypothetical protein
LWEPHELFQYRGGVSGRPGFPENVIPRLRDLKLEESAAFLFSSGEACQLLFEPSQRPELPSKSALEGFGRNEVRERGSELFRALRLLTGSKRAHERLAKRAQPARCRSDIRM